jgi:hypothetical protein
MLLRFARTEAGGAADIANASQSLETEELKHHFVRHQADEERHAELLRERATQIHTALEQSVSAPDSTSPDLLPLTASRERGSLALTDHGFLPSDCFAELGELRYIAMLHLAECQAAEDFRIHSRATRHLDPATSEVFRRILKDEEYHIAYTRAQLERWRRHGRGKQVSQALRQMRWMRWKSRGIQLMQACTEPLGRLFLSLIYCTLFLPFGLIGLCYRRPRGWVGTRRATGRNLNELRIP